MNNTINIYGKEVDINTLPVLTTENMMTASTVVSIAHPEWGTKSFTYAPDNNCYVGRGCNSSMLWEHEFKYWAIATTK